MRKNGTLSYILTDHLGSTSIMTNASGAMTSQMKYKAWGEVRFASGTNPTKYTYTGQYSNVSDFGLVFYNARWYDPVSGRFSQADTIVPAGVQGLDRYTYVNNSPIIFIDPTGHFTEDAVRDYLDGVCNGMSSQMDDCGAQLLAVWKADTEWWDMLSAAQEGDVLYGTATLLASGGGTVVFGFTFEGDGIDILTGITPVGDAEGMAGTTLNDVQQGRGESVEYGVDLTWMGIYRKSNSPRDAFPYARPGYEPVYIGTPNDAVRTEARTDFVVLGAVGCGLFGGGFGGAVTCGLGALAVEDAYFDFFNIEENDFSVQTGPIMWNMQMERGNSGLWNPERMWWYSELKR